MEFLGYGVGILEGLGFRDGVKLVQKKGFFKLVVQSYFTLLRDGLSFS